MFRSKSAPAKTDVFNEQIKGISPLYDSNLYLEARMRSELKETFEKQGMEAMSLHTFFVKNPVGFKIIENRVASQISTAPNPTQTDQKGNAEEYEESEEDPDDLVFKMDL